MAEGDSYAKAAATMRPVLVGAALAEVNGTAPAVRRYAGRLVGRTVTAVRTHGKHLLVDVDSDWSVHVHLGMNGAVRVAAAGSGDRRGELTRAGPDRLVLVTGRGIVRVSAAPRVEVDRTGVVDARVLGTLGPDLLADDLDTDELARRVRRVRADLAVADVLLDQRVLAGIGNVYKCEVLFLEGLHPAMPLGALDDDTLRSLVGRARALMRANLGPGRRVTTGDPRRPAWVYGRARLPCRRCGTAIAKASMGTPTPRVTYWCPTCQPAPAPTPR